MDGNMREALFCGKSCFGKSAPEEHFFVMRFFRKRCSGHDVPDEGAGMVAQWKGQEQKTWRGAALELDVSRDHSAPGMVLGDGGSVFRGNVHRRNRRHALCPRKRNFHSITLFFADDKLWHKCQSLLWHATVSCGTEENEKKKGGSRRMCSVVALSRIYGSMRLESGLCQRSGRTVGLAFLA